MDEEPKKKGMAHFLLIRDCNKQVDTVSDLKGLYNELQKKFDWLVWDYAKYDAKQKKLR